jgi:hypothetical protein
MEVGRSIVIIVMVTLFPLILAMALFEPKDAFKLFVVLVVIWNIEWWTKYRWSLAWFGIIVCLFMAAAGICLGILNSGGN